MKQKTLRIALLFLLIAFLVCIPHNVFARGEAGMTIVLDPGHGGKDNGTSGGGMFEKDVNFKIASYLKTYLEQYKNVKVILTHNGNLSVNQQMSNEDRSEVARKNNADLFISLHCNNIANEHINGAEIYVSYRTELDKYNKDTTILGNKILNNISSLGIANNGVKTRIVKNENGDPRYMYYDNTKSDYYGVIRWCMRGGYTEGLGPNFSDGSGVPAILIEHAYMSNSYDLGFLNSNEKLQNLAKADCKGIVDFYGLIPKDGTTAANELKPINGYTYGNRTLDITFDSLYYANRYKDLKSAYGNDPNGLYQHWLTFGIKEGRVASSIFDSKYYLANYPDLQRAFGLNKELARDHFLNIGCNENRVSSNEFHVLKYKANYPDLQKAFGNNLALYYRHYATNGCMENRIARFNKNDLQLVFDKDYYRNNNDDLDRIYGDNLAKLFNHYLNTGIDEGRKATANTQFDVDYYLMKNSDLQKAFGNNKKLAFMHFLDCGIHEKRLTSEKFNVVMYKSNYEDLQKAFGNNWYMYFKHYFDCGIKEGREPVLSLKELEQKKKAEEEAKKKAEQESQNIVNNIVNNSVNNVINNNTNIVNNTVNNAVNGLSNMTNEVTNIVDNTFVEEVLSGSISNKTVNNVITNNATNNTTNNIVNTNSQTNTTKVFSNSVIDEIIVN